MSGGGTDQAQAGNAGDSPPYVPDSPNTAYRGIQNLQAESDPNLRDIEDDTEQLLHQLDAEEEAANEAAVSDREDDMDEDADNSSAILQVSASMENERVANNNIQHTESRGTDNYNPYRGRESPNQLSSLGMDGTDKSNTAMPQTNPARQTEPVHMPARQEVQETAVSSERQPAPHVQHGDSQAAIPANQTPAVAQQVQAPLPANLEDSMQQVLKQIASLPAGKLLMQNIMQQEAPTVLATPIAGETSAATIATAQQPPIATVGTAEQTPTQEATPAIPAQRQPELNTAQRVTDVTTRESPEKPASSTTTKNTAPSAIVTGRKPLPTTRPVSLMPQAGRSQLLTNRPRLPVPRQQPPAARSHEEQRGRHDDEIQQELYWCNYFRRHLAQPPLLVEEYVHDHRPTARPILNGTPEQYRQANLDAWKRKNLYANFPEAAVVNSPVVNSPVVNSPVVNSPAFSSPVRRQQVMQASSPVPPARTQGYFAQLEDEAAERRERQQRLRREAERDNPSLAFAPARTTVPTRRPLYPAVSSSEDEPMASSPPLHPPATAAPAVPANTLSRARPTRADLERQLAEIDEAESQQPPPPAYTAGIPTLQQAQLGRTESELARTQAQLAQTQAQLIQTQPPGSIPEIPKDKVLISDPFRLGRYTRRAGSAFRTPSRLMTTILNANLWANKGLFLRPTKSGPLNLERASNLESALGQMAGTEAVPACNSCRQSNGPWTSCVVYPGFLKGSCMNCHWNNSSGRCSFHENNKNGKKTDKPSRPAERPDKSGKKRAREETSEDESEDDNKSSSDSSSQDPAMKAAFVKFLKSEAERKRKDHKRHRGLSSDDDENQLGSAKKKKASARDRPSTALAKQKRK